MWDEEISIPEGKAEGLLFPATSHSEIVFLYESTKQKNSEIVVALVKRNLIQKVETL